MWGFKAPQRWLVTLVSVVLANCFGGPASAEVAATPVRTVGGVVDYAKLFSPEQYRALEIEAGQLARRIDTDFFVVSIDDRSAQWADKRSHFAMVEKAFSDIEAAAAKHFGRSAPLTVLLVFKSSVVIHLKTSDGALTERLLFRNFYRGAEGALERIRQPGEAYGDAALRYLELFSGTLDEIAGASATSGFVALSEQARFWAFQRDALINSRKLIQQPYLDPLYMFMVWLINGIVPILTSLTVPSWIAFLLATGAIYFAIELLSSLVDQPCVRACDVVGNRFRVRNAEHIGEALAFFIRMSLTKGMLFLLVLLMFAVSQGDLESILYIIQVFGGEVVTYLDWSRGISMNDFHLPDKAIITAALASAFTFAALRWVKIHTADEEPNKTWAEWFVGLIPYGMTLLITSLILLWILSLVIWPGIMAILFILASWLMRTVEFASIWSKARNTQVKGGSDQPQPDKRALVREALR